MSELHDSTTRGYVVPIGGAEDKTGGAQILTRFAQLCGGRRARIIILPTASQLDDTGHRYAKLFRKELRCGLKCVCRGRIDGRNTTVNREGKADQRTAKEQAAHMGQWQHSLDLAIDFVVEKVSVMPHAVAQYALPAGAMKERRGWA